MTGGPGILIDFPIITAGESLIAKEVNGLVVDSRSTILGVCLGFDMLQTIGLVPTLRKDIKGDLTANGVSFISC